MRVALLKLLAELIHDERVRVVLFGLFTGLIHVLSGPDHLAAIAPYATLGRRRAWLLGLRWGAGHASGVLLVGLGALLLRGLLPMERLSAGSERVVGATLCLIGAWGLWKLWRNRAGHEAPVSHTDHGRHVHGRAALGVGVLHGLAGSSHLLGVVPALALPRLAAAAYLVLFGVGTVIGMTAFAGLLGLTSDRWAGRGDGWVGRALLGASSLAAIGVGGLWLAGGAF